MKITIKIAYLLLITPLLTLFGLTAYTSAKPTTLNNISGQLVDVRNAQVDQATVFIRGQQSIYQFVTNSSGQWVAPGLPTGQYEFYAYHPESETWAAPRRLQVDSDKAMLLTLAPQTNVIQAADFESADVWQLWERFNGEITTSSTGFDGLAAARLGERTGKEITCTQNKAQGRIWSIKQAVTIPNRSPVLSFMQQSQTNQTKFDYAWLEVVLLVDGQPEYLIPWGELWQTNSWQMHSFDLSKWQGKQAELLFQVLNCGQASYWVDIDRVSMGTWVPTQNPNPTPTPRITATPTSPSQPLTPTPLHTPVNPQAEFIGKARQLTACENQGKHHLFIYIEDAVGKGIADVKVRVFWPNGEAILKTGTKGEHAGLVDFPMFKGNYWVEVLGSSSDVVGPLTPDIPVDELCKENGNPVANSLFHYSYNVIFTKQ